MEFEAKATQQNPTVARLEAAVMDAEANDLKLQETLNLISGCHIDNGNESKIKMKLYWHIITHPKASVSTKKSANAELEKVLNLKYPKHERTRVALQWLRNHI
ncbi:MAG: hypothetical protein ACREBH_00420 [Candidatus Micrarchaeaceae archaeon]